MGPFRRQKEDYVVHLGRDLRLSNIHAAMICGYVCLAVVVGSYFIYRRGVKRYKEEIKRLAIENKEKSSTIGVLEGDIRNERDNSASWEDETLYYRKMCLKNHLEVYCSKSLPTIILKVVGETDERKYYSDLFLKTFVYNPDDPEDKAFAIRCAEELKEQIENA